MLLGEPRGLLKEIAMSQAYNHLNHATWECKYHVVFTPKYRKKMLFGALGDCIPRLGPTQGMPD